MSLPSLVVTPERLAALTSATDFIRSRGDHRLSDTVRQLVEMVDAAHVQTRDRTRAGVPWFATATPRPRE
jgi:hypothetical protein